LETYLQIYCQTNPETWVEHLPLSEFIDNHQKHDSHNASLLQYAYPIFIFSPTLILSTTVLHHNCLLPSLDDLTHSMFAFFHCFLSWLPHMYSHT
jgi:hypothetical protein